MPRHDHKTTHELHRCHATITHTCMLAPRTYETDASRVTRHTPHVSHVSQGEPSYEQYHKEKHDIIDSLRRRSQTLVQGLNKLEGVSCQDAEGALYAFPQIRLPPAAAAAAAALGKQPDWLYCKELLEATGVVVVPGSGFGQVGSGRGTSPPHRCWCCCRCGSCGVGVVVVWCWCWCFRTLGGRAVFLARSREEE